MQIAMMVSPPPASARPLQVHTQAALFFSAWIMGLYQVFYLGGYGFGRGFEMAAIARSLAEQGAYANPFAPLLTGPTALVPPLHPIFLAALMKIFGGPGWMMVATFANITANALIAALLPRLSMAFYGDAKAGIIGGLLWIFSMRPMPQWDASNTIAGLIVFCILTGRNIARRDGAGWAIAAGALGGLIVLTNPATAILLAAWLAFLFISSRAPWRYALTYASLAALTAAVCVAPWVIRNYRVFGALALRTSFGITIYSSNNDCAEPSLFQEMRSGCFQRTHPVASASEARLLQSLGEVQYDRLRSADTMRWIRSHPKRFAELTAGRIRDFWFPDPTPSPYTCYAMWAVTLLSIPGIILMIKRRDAVMWFVLFVWLAYPLLYYIVLSCDRYRYPILWTSLLPAGYGLAAMAGVVKTKLLAGRIGLGWSGGGNTAPIR